MTKSEIESLEKIINEIDIIITDLEDKEKKVTSKNLMKYKNDTAFLTRVIGIGKPRVYKPSWKTKRISYAFKQLLNMGPVKNSEIASVLDLYCSEAATYLARLKADRSEIEKIEILRQHGQAIRI
ncbi:hypothetical protein [Fulvivirga ligni]|uniref:hypothetical protein n=1 Tax=Fulvivirga ligni TaxID=2904246 RepID=UPI001F2AF89F|nr:hypothetical protein [Fulvivirga ligni]UII22500.1 hypothetical protein LVD16_04565 [Fulvivirga ligni]